MSEHSEPLQSDLIFEQWRAKLLDDVKTKDTKTVRAYLKIYPGNSKPIELEPLPQALVIAAENGRWPTVKLLLEKHDALLAHQRDAYILALRQGFSAAVKKKHTSVVQEILPKMRRLHAAGYSDLYYLTTLRHGFTNAVQSKHWIIVDTILPFLANTDYQAYMDILCYQFEEAVFHGVSESIKYLLPKFKGLRASPKKEHREAYAKTLNASVGTAIARNGQRSEAVNLLIYDFIALVRARPDHPDYRGTLYKTIRYAAKTGNLSLVKQALPLCIAAKKHDSSGANDALSSAYWNANEEKSSYGKTEKEIKNYRAVMNMLDPHAGGWSSRWEGEYEGYGSS